MSLQIKTAVDLSKPSSDPLQAEDLNSSQTNLKKSKLSLLSAFSPLPSPILSDPPRIPSLIPSPTSTTHECFKLKKFDRTHPDQLTHHQHRISLDQSPERLVPHSIVNDQELVDSIEKLDQALSKIDEPLDLRPGILNAISGELNPPQTNITQLSSNHEQGARNRFRRSSVDLNRSRLQTAREASIVTSEGESSRSKFKRSSVDFTLFKSPATRETSTRGCGDRPSNYSRTQSQKPTRRSSFNIHSSKQSAGVPLTEAALRIHSSKPSNSEQSQSPRLSIRDLGLVSENHQDTEETAKVLIHRNCSSPTVTDLDTRLTRWVAPLHKSDEISNLLEIITKREAERTKELVNMFRVAAERAVAREREFNELVELIRKRDRERQRDLLGGVFQVHQVTVPTPAGSPRGTLRPLLTRPNSSIGNRDSGRNTPVMETMSRNTAIFEELIAPSVRAASLAASLKAASLTENIRVASRAPSIKEKIDDPMGSSPSPRADVLVESRSTEDNPRLPEPSMRSEPGSKETPKPSASETGELLSGSTAKSASSKTRSRAQSIVGDNQLNEVLGTVSVKKMTEASVTPCVKAESIAPSFKAESAIPSIKEDTAVPIVEAMSVVPGDLKVGSPAPSVRAESRAPSVKAASVVPSVRAASVAPSVNFASVARSVKAESVALSIRAESAAPSVKVASVAPSVKAESVAPSVEASSVAPSIKAESVVPPSAKAESVALSVKVASGAPKINTESVAPSVKAESVAPSAKAESVAPSVKAESVAPSVTPESLAPGAKAESEALSAKAESVAPSIKAESVVLGVKALSVAPSLIAQSLAPAESLIQSIKAASERLAESIGESVNTRSESAKAPDEREMTETNVIVSGHDPISAINPGGGGEEEKSIIEELSRQDSGSLQDTMPISIVPTTVNQPGKWIREGQAGFKFILFD